MASLNLGYEALLDLAKALQIEPADISLGNSLSIAFGVSCTDALAGLDVAFAQGTEFVVDADCVDAGMLSRGADLTDTGIVAPDGINVRIQVSSIPVSCIDVAIATVNQSDADSFTSKLNVRRVSRCKTSMKRVANEDGTVTLMAAVSPAGFCISIK